ncbi:MAG: hypothetical protein AB7F35_06345 [Acetobacteraceae bacterium]
MTETKKQIAEYGGVASPALTDRVLIQRGATGSPFGHVLVGDFLDRQHTTSDVTGNSSVGGALAVSGAATFGSTLGLTGNFSVNTNKFVVAASSGDTAVAGTFAAAGAATFGSTLGLTGNFAVNTDKFVVTASSGNTAVAGTFAATGAATFGSTVTLSQDPAADLRAATKRYVDTRTLTFDTIAAAKAYASYATALVNNTSLTVQVRGYYSAGDGGGGTFDAIAQTTKTTSGATASGAVLLLSSTSGLSPGMGVSGTNIPARAYILSIVSNTSITISASVSGTVSSGATVTFHPRAVDEYAIAFAGTGATLVRRVTNGELAVRQAGLRADYIMPIAYETTASSSASTTVTIGGGTTGIQQGWWAHHPAVPYGTTVTAVTSTTVTLSTAVTLDSGTWVCFNPGATDDTNQLMNVTGFDAFRGITLVIPQGQWVYCGSANQQPRIEGAFARIRGAGPVSTDPGNLVGNYTAGGFQLRPGRFIWMKQKTSLVDLVVMRAGLPANPKDMDHYNLYRAQWAGENGVPGTVVARPVVTSRAAQNTLTISVDSTTGISSGMYVTGAGLGDRGFIGSVSANSLTLRLGTPTEILAGTTLTVHSEPRTIGIYVSQADIQVQGVSVVGFNLGMLVTQAADLENLHFDTINGMFVYSFKEGKVGRGWVAKMRWVGSDATAAGQDSDWEFTDTVSIDTAGQGYVVGDLLHDEYNNLVKITSVDGSGGVTGISDPIWRGAMPTAPSGAVNTNCWPISDDGDWAPTGGTGYGAKLSVTTVTCVVNHNYMPGIGFWLGNDINAATFYDLQPAGKQYGLIIDNCSVNIRGLVSEGNSDQGQGMNNIGIWTWNTCNGVEISDIQVSSFDTLVYLGHTDRPWADRKSTQNQSSNCMVTLINMQVQATNEVPVSPIIIGPRSRGKIIGGTVSAGTDYTESIITVQEDVFDWSLIGVGVVVSANSASANWIDIDPTSARRVKILDCEMLLRGHSARYEADEGYDTFQGPSNISRWPLQISFDPSSITPIDGSRTEPLVLQSREGGTGLSKTLVLTRGGGITEPGEAGYVGTNTSELVIDTAPAVNFVSSATVSAGGAGYNIGDELYDDYGGIWRVATVDASGAVTNVTPKNWAVYTGSHPGTVATTTDNVGGSGGRLNTGISGDAVTASVSSAGNGYYSGRVAVEFGLPGEYDADGLMEARNTAGTRATAALTVTSGQLSGISVSGGDGYSGSSCSYRIVGTPASGCTLTLGGATNIEILSLNPSGGLTRFGGKLNAVGLPTSSSGLDSGDVWVDTSAANVLKMV